MARLVLTLAFGLCLLGICEAQITLNISCRFQGVFHVERNGRYNLAREEAVQLCEVLNTTLATMDQMIAAREAGFETCRYGWIEGNIVIPRIHENPICAANNIGVYILVSNITEKYDAYCYNVSETRMKVCDKILLPENYRFPLPIDFDQSSPQDTLHTDGTQTGYGDDESKNDKGDDQHDISDHGQYPDGSTSQGASDHVTNTPQSEDPNQHDHSDGYPAYGADDVTDAALPGDSDQGYQPGGFPGQQFDDATTPSPTGGYGHEHPPGGPSYQGEDEDITDAPHHDVFDHGHHHHGGSSDQDLNKETTDDPHSSDSPHGHHPGGSQEQGADEDTTDDPQPGDFPQRHHPSGSSEPGRDEQTTIAPQAGDSLHEDHLGGSHGQDPVDVTDDPLHDEQSTVTDEGNKPQVYPGNDSNEGSPHSGSKTVTDKSHTDGSDYGVDSEDATVTDPSNAYIHPYINDKGVTESEDSDLSNFVDSHAGTETSPAGDPHQTRYSDLQPGSRDEGHSGNLVPYTDSTTADAHAGHDVPGVDDHIPDGEHENELVNGFTTTAGVPILPDSTDDGYSLPRPNEAHPELEDGAEATSSVDWTHVHGGDGNSHDGKSAGEGDNAASGGLLTTKQPRGKRTPYVPDWLIVVVALVCLALILAVCIAVNSRQTCGHKKKLVINGSGGAMEEGRMGEMNGDPSRSQEMVNLVPKEPPCNAGDPQQKLVDSADMRNQQNIDMKIGV
ncbi:CD44 antigen [Ambystoma mexicanum]|uniref:CD44 antigen n=1 Tax=Ambystoma mexicanum TaxID=8296 RepID=UPI0037E8C9B1